MTKNSKLASGLIIIVGLIALAMASTATAKPQNSGQRGERERGRPMFGEILNIGDDSITIAPKIPDFIAEKMAEHGVEPPSDMPDEVELLLSSDTKWFVDGKKSAASSFGVGDLIAVVVRPNREGPPTALKVSDEQTAKQFMQQQQRAQQGGNQRGGQGGNQRGGQAGNQRGGQQKGNQGPGNGNDRGGQGNNQQRQRPAFGEIIAINGDSITIRPEIPAFIQAKIDERGGGKEIELPDELTFSLSDKTRYVVDGEPTDSNPFGVGDKVAVMGNGKQDRKAFAVADYATVEAKMQGKGGQGPGGGQGKGERRDPNKQGKKGKRGGKQGQGPQGKR